MHSRYTQIVLMSDTAYVYSLNGYHRSGLEVGEVKLSDVCVSGLSMFQEV
jgi:hypothetical protein